MSSKSATPKGRRQSSSASASSSPALATPKSGKKAAPGKAQQNPWTRCPQSGLFRHRLCADQHQAWSADRGGDLDRLDHVVLDGEGDDGCVAGPAVKAPAEWRRPLSAHRAVFVPEPLMSVWGVGFADFVRVRYDSQSIAVVLRVFPAPPAEDGRSTIFCSEDQFTQGLETRMVRMWRVAAPVSPISNVKLRLASSNNLDGVVDGETCQTLLEGAVLTVGERLQLRVYCRTCHLEVDDMELGGGHAAGDVDNVVDRLANVHLRETTFGVLTCSSRVHVVSAVVEENSTESSSARPRVEDLGGLDEEVARLKKRLGPTLSSSKESVGGRGGVLLWGPPGSGKTALVEALAVDLGTSLVTVSAGVVASKLFGETEKNLKSYFEEAESRQPAIVLLDEVDVFCGGGGRGDHDRRVASTLAGLLDDLRKKSCRVAVVATANSPERLDSRLRTPGRLDMEIEIEAPNPDKRRDILTKHIEKQEGVLSGEDIWEIASWCHGYVGVDLQSLVQTALESSHEEGSGLSLSHFKSAMKQVKPSAMKEVLIEVPSVTWADIGGLEEVKLSLRQSVSWPLEHPEVFERMGISPPRGVLMYGPPGCSKTMIAKALANESGLNFLSVKGPELFSKWVGDSERAVRELFRKARQVAPAIVFFDEIDALGSERSSGKGGGSGGGGSDVGNRVLAQLLTEMDGVEQLKAVTVVAATNRPDLMDGALMRPGRLDRQLFVPLPDAETREKVFAVHCRRKPVAASIDFARLVGETDGYSGAEIAAVCNEAAFKAMQDILEEKTSDVNTAEIEMRHFQEALNLVKPRVKPELLQIYKDFNNKSGASR